LISAAVFLCFSIAFCLNETAHPASSFYLVLLFSYFPCCGCFALLIWLFFLVFYYLRTVFGTIYIGVLISTPPNIGELCLVIVHIYIENHHIFHPFIFRFGFGFGFLSFIVVVVYFTFRYPLRSYSSSSRDFSGSPYFGQHMPSVPSMLKQKMLRSNSVGSCGTMPWTSLSSASGNQAGSESSTTLMPQRLKVGNGLNIPEI